MILRILFGNNKEALLRQKKKKAKSQSESRNSHKILQDFHLLVILTLVFNDRRPSLNRGFISVTNLCHGKGFRITENLLAFRVRLIKQCTKL